MVLRVHQDKTYPGALVASLSVPWGNSTTSARAITWCGRATWWRPAGALLALGAVREARNTLRYLLATQHEDGHWYQNQWLGGRAHWTGLQLDETAFPVLLAVALDERGALHGIAVADMIGRALSFLARHGPASDQDRWEEDAGLNTFTLAVCIAALVAGAATCLADGRDLALALADYWNARLEDWTAPTTRHSRAVRRARLLRAHRAARRSRMTASCRIPCCRSGNLEQDPQLPAADQVGATSCSWCVSACGAPTTRW